MNTCRNENLVMGQPITPKHHKLFHFFDACWHKMEDVDEPIETCRGGLGGKTREIRVSQCCWCGAEKREDRGRYHPWQ